MPSQRRPALAEMGRVLDRCPESDPATLPGGVRVTRPWSHGELHADTQPMREHVLIAYRDGPAQRICRSVGRERRVAATLPGTVTIIPAGQAAHWDIDGAIAVSHLYLPPARLPAASQDGRPVELLDRLAVDDPTLVELMAIVARESQAGDAPARLLVEQALDLLALQLARRHAAHPQAPPPARGGLAAWQLRRVVDCMQARLAEPVTLDELAALAGLSRYHFCAAFQRTMGAPPHRWLRALRMKEARRLLADPRLSVLEVALSVGYETPSAFARAFRAAEGLNPADFRRRR
ncbi:MAG TPA: AraC family transcriptional regulator [Burkholderiaceae bacterium]